MKIQALALLMLLTLPACAQDLQARISKAARAPGGMRVGVYVKLLKTGETAQVDGKRPYPLASVFKLPVMVELARQMQAGRNGLQLATRLEVSQPEKCIGSGHLQDQPDGTPVSVERLIELMETISDNTATDMLFRRIGLDSVNQMMAGLGCTHTDIFLTNRAAWLISLGQSSDFRGLDPESIAARWRSLNAEQRMQAAQRAEKENLRLTLSRFQALEDESARSNSHDQDVLVATTVDNLSSPEDLGLLLEKLATGAALSRKWTDYCLGVLARQRYNTRLPKLLPREVKVLHKTGTIAGVVNDVGLLQLPSGEQIVVVALISGVGRGQSGQADRVIAQIALAAYQAATR